ncbi:MAG: prepilin peptidase [Candidatus Nealsonbacteria bacterium]|nr:MAG: prepilin peptidase [Candidatus Nealsonbacteria bacterium]
MFTSLFFDFALLAPLFIIGGICSYTDIRYGKIFNKWIATGFFCGILFYIFLFFYNFFFLFQISNIQYLIKVGINALLAFLVGYLLWHLKLWSAGDAKFFALCSFLLPLKFYSKSYLSYFPSFNLLINLFVPLLLVLTATAFFKGIKETYNHRARLKNIGKLDIKKLFPKLKNLGKKFFPLFLSYVLIFIFLQGISSFKKNIPGGRFLFNPLFLFLFLLLILGYLSKVREKKKWIGYFINGTVLIYCSYLLFFGKIEILKSILKQTLIFMVLITLFRQFLNFYIEEKEVKKIKVRELKKGAVISKNELPLILQMLKEKKMENNFGEIDAAGLNENQVKTIKDLFIQKPQLKVKTYKTFSFAPFMLLSVVISIVTQSSFIDFLTYKL